ncbi:MAG: hypothetical protein JNK29_08975 [Anaerolineales bacterium]|nr:hypothetical protein [Anaerolineales bacterium]
MGLTAGIGSLAVSDLRDLYHHSAQLAAAQPATLWRAEFSLALAALRVLLDFYLLAALGLLGSASLPRAWVGRVLGAFVAAGLLGVNRLAALQTRLLTVIILRLALRLTERLLGFEVQGRLEAAFFVIAVALALLGGFLITDPARFGSAPAASRR